MKITLEKTKLKFSESPKSDIQSAIILLTKDKRTIFVDAHQNTSTYKLPGGLKSENILAIYLRVI